MAVYQLLIGGVARVARRGSLRLLRRINARPVLDVEVQSLDGSYLPHEGDPVALVENGVTIYGGRVQHPATSGLDEQPIRAVATRIDCVDQSVLAEEVFLNSTWVGGTLKQFLQFIITGYLGAKGVTLDPAQVDGPTLPARTFTYRSNKKVSEALTDFCALAVGYTWTISPTKVLKATPPNLVSAPFHLGPIDPRGIGDVTREQTSELYANRIIVLGNTNLMLYYKDDFTAMTNGTRTVFPLTLLPSGPLPHLPNAGVVYVIANAGYEVGETFGMASATWIYDPVANTITDQGNAGGTTVTAYRTFPLPAGRPMWIIYDGTPLAFAVAEDVAAQAPPRYVVERLVFSELSDLPSLQTIANAELAKMIHQPITVTYETDELGLEPGMWQIIDRPSRGIPNVPYILQEIETRDVFAMNPDKTPRLRHRVTASEYIAGTTAYPDRVGDLYTLWSTDRGGSLGAAPAVSSGGAGAVPVTEDQIILSDVTTNDVSVVRHGFAPKAPNLFNTFLNGGNPPGWQYIQEAHLTLSDNTVNNVTSARHGLAPKSTGLFNTFLGGDPPAFQYVTDQHLTLSDNTANDVTTAKHGFAPKAPNDATKFLNGTGVYSVPAGAGGGTWTDVSYSASNFFASGSMTFTVTAGQVGTFAYVLVGPTAIVTLRINNGAIGGTPATYLYIRLPVTATKGILVPMIYLNATASWVAGFAEVPSGANYVQCVTTGGAAWPVGGVYLGMQFSLSI